MGNFTKQRERRKRMEEGDKVRREKIGGYFLNLSQLVFVALVLGGISPVYTNEEIGVNGHVLFVGICLTVLLAVIGSKILK